jgi:hypothetical protein
MQARAGRAIAAASIEQEVAALETLDLNGLREVWRARFGPPPKLRSVELLRLNIAWRIQAEAFGGLDADMRRRLRRASGGGDVADRLEPGTRLTREWKGSPHEVVVGEDGYLYAGRSWKSLSEIGREITGVRVNGPRFFGLRPEPRKAAA